MIGLVTHRGGLAGLPDRVIPSQLRVHVHNHITQAVAATDSGFAIVGAH